MDQLITQEHLEPISFECKKFLEKCLQHDPSRRSLSPELSKQRWIVDKLNKIMVNKELMDIG